MESERRQSPRYPFLAAAELIESTSGARLEAATSDLGSDGCYLIRLVRCRRALSSAFKLPIKGRSSRLEPWLCIRIRTWEWA